MTRLLLDTHAFLWFVFDDPRLSSSASSAIADSAERLLSVASLWDITIKRQLGKLDLGMELPEFFRRFVDGGDLTLLPIRPAHLLIYDQLPLLHRDPFDRLLVAQAQANGVPLVTGDPEIRRYDVETVW